MATNIKSCRNNKTKKILKIKISKDLLSPKFLSTSKQIWPNQSTPISPEIIRKHFFADFKGSRTNQFAQIRPAMEAKFGNETLRKSRNIYKKSTLATYN